MYSSTYFSHQTNSGMAAINLLSTTECQQIRDLVFNLQSWWEQRQPNIPFYTLGAASYLDANPYRSEYLSKARKYNQILSANLDWFYHKLSNALGQYLQTPIAYPQHLALPGFHIYQSSKLFEQPIASIHFDRQYELIDWHDPAPDFTNSISFTLAIALPQYGGGLNMWELHYHETRGRKISLPELLTYRAQSFHAYAIGQLVLHSGHQLHQAAPAIKIQPTDERITIQGHGLFSQGHWQIYW